MPNATGAKLGFEDTLEVLISEIHAIAEENGNTMAVIAQ